MVISNRNDLFFCRELLSKSVPASVVVSICRGFNLSFYSLALSRKGEVFPDKTPSAQEGLRDFGRCYEEQININVACRDNGTSMDV